MNPSKEFSRFAKTYQKYKIIQTKVAKHLISKIDSKPKKILDLGAGSGEVYKNINWDFDNFIAVDSSKEMLNLHPDFKVKKLLCDFSTNSCFDILKKERFDLIIASSSLQWSQDLDFTFKEISKLNKDFIFAIFTDKTFETIHKIVNIKSPIYSLEEILSLSQKYFLINYEIKRYRLFFKNSLEMFRYIKKSGVSSGRKRLSYKEMKFLIDNYPYKYLEFEVVFLWNKK
ncbi:methyltransferase domain-containing protein [Nitrosophilus kaiyonis]|uniref:methyltransferase domain-containing protein n=1 Tax=Nitrosophilus kaiyonis TaxID=2930200 RepID=UPI00248FA1CF|nr:methyltransferase domain-containing protein [Nitrosophilus kaiyonis]